MSNDPAFLFYSSDFLTGVSDLTMEERGQYITLLCLQHQKGHLSEKLINISVGNATADVLAKFKVDKDGLYYNERVDVEKEKRKQHSDKQRDRAISGWKKRKADQSHGNATAMPLEDVNDNKDIIDNKVKEEEFKKQVFSHDQYDNDLLTKFFNYWSEPNKTGKKMKFEMQQTFEIKRRLVTWSGNDFNTTKKTANHDSDY